MAQGRTVTGGPSGEQRAANLHRAAEAIEEALEEVDLEAQPEQGTRLISALSAIDRAQVTRGSNRGN